VAAAAADDSGIMADSTAGETSETAESPDPAAAAQSSLMDAPALGGSGSQPPAATAMLRKTARKSQPGRSSSSRKPPRGSNRTLGSSAYSALEPSEDISGLSRAKLPRKIRKEEERMARVQAEEQKLRRRRQRQEKAGVRRRQHEKDEKMRQHQKHDWGSTLSLPDIRANPRADPALCYGARSVPPIR
jgi:hypothetical protein